MAVSPHLMITIVRDVQSGPWTKMSPKHLVTPFKHTTSLLVWEKDMYDSQTSTNRAFTPAQPSPYVFGNIINTIKVDIKSFLKILYVGRGLISLEGLADKRTSR